ncbi:hypothetical protein E2C01_102805 [Portunus trituberculatus]|uniref:Uncharacterized protein n=1 Tax=Portunus trituberculatus TaxID=210409 RepID=A0A5B7KJD2_PORTR|nr:hypothetical protein [Portunus trituberculatus]
MIRDETPQGTNYKFLGSSHAFFTFLRILDKLNERVMQYQILPTPPTTFASSAFSRACNSHLSRLFA